VGVVVCLMDMTGGKIPEALMGSFGIVETDISADLIPSRLFIGIAADNINILLFGGAEEPLRQRIICGSSHTCIAQIRPHEREELLRHPGGVGRSPVCPQFRRYVPLLYRLSFQCCHIDMLHMGGIDRGIDILGDQIPGEEIDNDNEIPSCMVDKQLVSSHTPT
jgi:hypothetical protein